MPLKPQHSGLPHGYGDAARTSGGPLPLRAALAGLAVLTTVGCADVRRSGSEASQASERSPTDLSQVERFCGDCHAMPQPHTFPSHKWDEEVRQGFRLYAESGRTDLVVPDIDAVIDWYAKRAPAQLLLPEIDDTTDSAPVRFRREAFAPGGPPVSYGIADLNYTPDGLFLCDMKTGGVARMTFDGEVISGGLIERLGHPAHIERCDLDADGQYEYLIADLGSYAPADHANGRILLIRPPSASRPPQTVVLEHNLGRVADCRCADFTGDGLPDILIAEFGWRTTGSLRLLVQQPQKDAAEPGFESRQLDPRHGASHTPVMDLDGDGDLDFVALFSQEHEVVVAFVNRGDGHFDQHVLFSAGDPDYGSSCLWPADIDGDGDLDFVYSNGDSMDAHELKPSHSIQWLENQGDLTFAHHHIDQLPGAYGVATADFDSDGDIDIVACAMTWRHDVRFPNLVLFEQTAGGFQRHNLEISSSQHAVLEVADFDGDGDPDIAVGEFEERDLTSPSPFSVWWNEGPR